MQFATLETRWPAVRGVPPSLWVTAQYWPRKDVPKFTPTKLVNTVVTRARVDAGRWIADCPFCPSAQHVSKVDRRFFCSDCLMMTVDGAMIHVLWPSDDKIAEIERLLGLRKVAAMHWRPDESLDQLIAENVEHGVPV